ncbi:hypothetical protein HUS23_04360 [Ectothiorhodospiraceae bacterium 2226]|nr:hypothetical protein HUS23_04360 [Ectothiorhodospiraceae bacterium 2226]
MHPAPPSLARVWLRRALRTLLGTAALLLILVAIAFALTRQFVDDAHPMIERWVTEELGQPVRVGEIEFALVRGNPALTLHDAALLDAQGGTVVAFDRLHVPISLLASARARSVQSDGLILEGLDLRLSRADLARLSARWGEGEEPRARNGAVYAWLLAQERLELRGARLYWEGAPALERVNLRLERARGEHRLTGRAQLSGGGRLALDLAVEAAHAPREPARWRVDGGVAAEAVALEALARLTGAPKSLKGRGSLELRLTGGDGRLAADGALDLRYVALEQRMLWPFLRGEARAEFTRRGWALDTALRGPRQQERQAPLTLRAAGADGGMELMVASLAPNEVDALRKAFTPKQGLLADYLAEAAPRAELRDLAATRSAGGAWTYTGSFSEFRQSAWRVAPAVEGVAGRFVAGPEGARVWLAAPAAKFDFPRLFRAPLRARIEGPLRVHEDAAGWRIDVEEVAVENADLATTVRGNVRPAQQGRPAALDIAVAVARADPRQVTPYVPARIMPEAAVKWLDEAFIGGAVTGGEVLYRGPVTGFPPPGGTFEARFGVRDLGLHFAPGWPALEGGEAEVAIVGRGLEVRAREGRLLNAELGEATARIADLRRPVLELQAAATGPVDDLLRIARDTPLRQVTPAALDDLAVAGPTDLAFNLTLPIGAAREQAALHWSGTATLRDAQLTRGPFTLTHLNGTLDFADGAFRGEDLHGRWGSATLHGAVRPGEAGGHRVSGVARVPGEEAARWLRLPGEVFAGESDWQVALDLGGGAADGWSFRAESDLAGLAVELPEPFAKAPEASRTTRIDLTGAEDDGQALVVRYGEHAVRAHLRDGAVTAAAIGFGGQAPARPEAGSVHVGGRLERLDIAGWPALERGSGAEGDTESGLARLRWEIALARLGLVNSAASPATEASPVGQPATSPHGFDPGVLPAARVQVREFSYQALPLGALNAEVARRPRGVDISGFTLRGGLLTADARAEWQRGSGGDRFSVSGAMEARDVVQVSRALGLWQGLDARRSRVEGSMFWLGAPWRPQPQTVNGALRLELYEGALHEVEPGAGRLVGLLGISVLPRRLRLDFRDVFYEGFRFDEARGSLRFAGGRAVTEDFRMQGPAARIAVTGNADLVGRAYDHRVTVVPHIGQAAPIAGTLAWGPQVGAVLLIAQQLFRSSVDEAVTARYSVTGPWDAPTVARLAAPARTPDYVDE